MAREINDPYTSAPTVVTTSYQLISNVDGGVVHATLSFSNYTNGYSYTATSQRLHTVFTHRYPTPSLPFPILYSGNRGPGQRPVFALHRNISHHKELGYIHSPVLSTKQGL